MMPISLLDLPDTVLRSIRRHLSESHVLHFRTVSRHAAQSHLVLADPVLTTRLALIASDEESFLHLVPPFSHKSTLFCDLVRVLVRMDAPLCPRWVILRRWTHGRTVLTSAQHRDLVAYASHRGSADALTVLLAWKTRTGKRMVDLTPVRGRKIYASLEAALVHPRIVGRPDFFPDWLLTHMDVFVSAAGVPPRVLLHQAIVFGSPAVFLKVLHRVFPSWHRDGSQCIAALANMADPPLPSRLRAALEYMCMAQCNGVLHTLYTVVPNAREPVQLVRAILAAIVIGQVRWRPDHPLASSTAVRVDFGLGMTRTDGIAALRAVVVQAAGGDTVVADGLVDSFEKMPPVAVRNALVSFAPLLSGERRTLVVDLVVAVVAIDPPALATVLDHELNRIAPLSSLGDSQQGSKAPHKNAPLWIPESQSTPNLVVTAIDRCGGCRQQLLDQYRSMDEAAECEWGIVVNVPAPNEGPAIHPAYRT